jgi:glutaredoxin 3
VRNEQCDGDGALRIFQAAAEHDHAGRETSESRVNRRTRYHARSHSVASAGLVWAAANPPFDRKIHREFPETTLSNPIITIYSTAICPYCVAAKNFLKSKGLSWNEIRIDTDPAEREKMVAKARRTSVPQIFVGDTHVGGYDDMMALHRAGKLEALLAGA